MLYIYTSNKSIYLRSNYAKSIPKFSGCFKLCMIIIINEENHMRTTMSAAKIDANAQEIIFTTSLSILDIPECLTVGI